MSGRTDTVDLQSAADEIGVHYQTAYRWVRNGRLRAVTVDGKYQIERNDLDSFIRARLEPQKPVAPTARRLTTTSDSMYDALLSGDEAAATALARGIVADGGPIVQFIQRVLVPPLRRIGNEWGEGRVSVWQEHRASAIAERILGEIARNPRGRRRGVAMVAGAEGERHSLATTMAAVALRDSNWTVHHLGTDIPNHELTAFCRTHPLDLAVISLANTDVARSAHAVAREIEQMGIPTLVGAPGRTLDDLVEEARRAARAAKVRH